MEKLDDLRVLLDEILASHAIDEERIYLTGLSMGGAGAWYFAANYPDRFAALAPICGAGLWWQGFPARAASLKNMPIRTFHGEEDPVVPIKVTEEIVDFLKEKKGNIRFTRYPGVEHNSWTQTYQNPALYEWFFQQKLNVG